MAYLVLVRHGLSEYNKLGLWAGWIDVELVDEGREEAELTAHKLLDIRFDNAFVSSLKRAKDTLKIMLPILQQELTPITEAKELNERNYGDYAGKNKWQVKESLGEEEFMKLRRSWDYPIPNGESLKQVYERVIPYYKTHIEPRLKEGENILIVSSGNALRALVKYLENVSESEITKLEIGTGEAYVYEIDRDGHILKKEIRGQNPKAGKV